MAANDYYQSFQAPPPYSASTPSPDQYRPNLAPAHASQNYLPQQSQSYSPQSSQVHFVPTNAPQQQFLKPILKNSHSHQGHPSPQPWNPQQSQYAAPAVYQGSPLARPSNNNLLAPPGNALVPSRSRSEPPENRRMSLEPHHHHHRHHSRSRSRSRSSRSDSRDRNHRNRSISSSRSRSRPRSHHSHHSHHSSSSRKDSHSGRSTFLGAGAGGLIGDAILPGLGTLLGALGGGLGGHEYSEKKGKKSRSTSDSGYRDGVTVHSGFIRR